MRCAPPQTVQRAPGHVRAPRACARWRAARSRWYNGTIVPRTAFDSAHVAPACMSIKSAASAVRSCDIRARAFNIAPDRPSAPPRWRPMGPLCSRLQVRTAGMGGRALLHTTSGASRHHKSNARAFLRAPRPATRVTRVSPAQKPKVRPIEPSPPHTGPTYAGNVRAVHTPGNVLAPRNAHQQFLPLNRCVRWAKGGQKYTLSSTDTSVQRQKLLMCVSRIKLILWVLPARASLSESPGRHHNVSVRLIEVPEAPR